MSLINHEKHETVNVGGSCKTLVVPAIGPSAPLGEEP
jgi:hypothetical protein